jgi:hypothetical protein
MKAFPQDSDGKFMDLRDYFAAQAMQAIKCSDIKTTAEYCYLLADAMMKARESND